MAVGVFSGYNKIGSNLFLVVRHSDKSVFRNALFLSTILVIAGWLALFYTHHQEFIDVWENPIIYPYLLAGILTALALFRAKKRNAWLDHAVLTFLLTTFAIHFLVYADYIKMFFFDIGQIWPHLSVMLLASVVLAWLYGRYVSVPEE